MLFMTKPYRRRQAVALQA